MPNNELVYDDNMDPAIDIQNVSVVLGKRFKALQQVNLQLPAGRIIGLIGPSGAGKTTLIRALVGNVRISSGTIRVLGLSPGSTTLHHRVRYMSQELSIYTDLTVRENLRYFIAMYGQQSKPTGLLIDEVLVRVDLSDKIDTVVSTLSGGEKQRVSLSIALVGSPEILMLDEPTVGLDPVLRESLWRLFNQLANQGVTLLVSSHVMDEASRCQDLILIRNGQIIAHSSPDAFLQETNASSIEQGFIKAIGDNA